MHLIGSSFSKGQDKKGSELTFEHLIEKGILNLLPITYHENLVFDKEKDFIDEYMHKLSNKACASRKEDFTLFLGGDHTVSIGTVSGILKAEPNTSLIWVDSHADYNTVNSSITGNLHGMPLNALINGTKTFNSLLFQWLNSGLIKPENVALIGINDVDPKEKELLEVSGINVYWQEDIFYEGIQWVLQDAIKKVKGDYLHLSFDVDAINHKEFPSTGCYCPNGMDLSTAYYIISELKKTGKLESMDLVEYNCLLDNEGKDHKIVFELLSNLL
jgi:arginase